MISGNRRGPGRIVRSLRPSFAGLGRDACSAAHNGWHLR